MRFRILGPLVVPDDEGREVVLGGPRQRAVLAILLLHSGEVVPGKRLIDELWGERAPGGARKTIQVYVSNLRKALGRGVLRTSAGGYQLDAAPGEIDAERFEAPIGEGRRALRAEDPALAAERLREALALWRGPALADFCIRAVCAERSCTAAGGAAGRAGGQARRRPCDRAGGELVGELEALSREHPLRERLHAQLMLALYRSGRQADALAVYQRTRAHLDLELGLEPGQELKELQLKILEQEPSLRLGDASPAAEQGVLPTRPSGTVPATNLPLHPGPLLGRREELAQLMQLAAASRLVTLTGPGGSGKTRLALGLGARLSDDYQDGAWWVPLAAVTDPGLVLPSVMEVLGARGELRAHLAGKRMLLLLDNLEQVLDCAPLIAELLAGLPELRVVATSRERLAISFEQEYPVPPLDEATARELFVARARQLEPDFQPDEAVGEICERLDRLPLALELASTRVKVMSTTQMLTRLEHRLDLLSRGKRGAPDRQTTMRATIDWSYDLLSEAEQTLFRGLGVFAGSFELEAAQAVCGADLDDLQSLIEKSLATRRTRPLLPPGTYARIRPRTARGRR
jgi:DNA-binding SARP family transcriptional activator